MSRKRTQRNRVSASVRSRRPYIVFSGSKNAATASLKPQKFATYACRCCDTQIAFGTDVPGFQPICPTCGTSLGNKPISTTTVRPVEDDLTLAVCPYCSTANVLDDKLLREHANLHCTGCGTQVLASDEDDGDEDYIDKDIYSVDADVDVDVDTQPDSDTVNDIPEKDLFETDPISNVKLETEADEGTDSTNTDDADTADSDSDEEESWPILKQPYVGNEEVVATTYKTSASLRDRKQVDFVKVNLADALVSTGKGKTQLLLAKSSIDGEPEVIALVDDLPVMRLVKEDAGDKADLIDNQGFLDILESEANTSGHNALAGYGFKPICASLNVGKIVAREVKASMQENNKTYTKKVKEVDDDYKQCFAIALAALTTNFYRKEYGNPLMEGIVATLKAHGVKQGKQVTRAAFATASTGFLKSVHTLTAALLQKPVEVRNEIALAIEQSNPDLYGDDEEYEDEGQVDTKDTMEQSSVLASLSGANLRAVDNETRSSLTTASNDNKVSDQEVASLLSRYRQIRNL